MVFSSSHRASPVQSWYFHSLPLLLWCKEDMYSDATTAYPLLLRISLLVVIEAAFLTFPATPLSSVLLQLAHFAILLQVRPPKRVFRASKTSATEVKKKK